MSGNGHIFLSYRTTESDFALRLAADLKSAGVRLWMDRLDSGIKIGDDWVQILQNAVNNCAGMISVISPEYVKAKYCRRELKRADTLGRPIFPVLIETVSDESWPLEIQEKQYVDFRERNDNRKYRQRLDELLEVLGTKSSFYFEETPDLETCYLLELISELEQRRGVLEYVDLPGQAELVETERPNPMQNTGWADEFALLLDFNPEKILSTDRGETRKLSLPNIEKASDDYPRFVLTGKPGTGKTTTLRRLALKSAKHRLVNPHSAPLPLFLDLSNWKDEPPPLDFIFTYWPFRSIHNHLLSSGDVSVYFDGLNEIGQKRNARAEQLRQWLSGNEAPAKVIISCRIDDYTEDLFLPLPTVLVGELNYSRIERFAVNYLGKDGANDFLLGVYPKESMHQSDSRSLAPLAKNPYLLSALIYISLNAPTLDLPRNMGQLFHVLIKALWTREKNRSSPAWVPFENMQRSLSKIAYAMIQGDMGGSATKDFVCENIKNVSLLDVARSANLITIKNNQFSFYHQLIQEYFAAVHLINERIDPSTLLEVDRKESLNVYSQVMGGKWKYVVIAWSGLIGEADYVLKGMTEISAALLIGDGYVASERRINEIIDYYDIDFAASHHYDVTAAWAAYISLGKVTHSFLLKKARKGSPVERGRAIYIIGRNRIQSAVDLLISSLSDTTEYYGLSGRICDEAAAALEKIGSKKANLAVNKWKKGLA